MCPVCGPGVSAVWACCVVCVWVCVVCGLGCRSAGKNSVVRSLALRLVAVVPLTLKRDSRVFGLGFPSRARTVAGTMRMLGIRIVCREFGGSVMVDQEGRSQGFI
ncbi:hypothetical protein LZ30DRAFT_380109 [Colletotrichum cereale]|nr:hypothetical protein LZ30DRAFT_380109 [Colletotrichum cereale]